jgi:4-amino-4-deoxy-L-arabinose transferase
VLILPWIPLLAAVAISLPWSLAIAAREPDFWRYFFWEEHIHRFFSQTHAQHENPFWYFIPIFIAGTIPWIFTAPFPLRDLLRQRRTEPMIRFALCWLIAPFLFFSASSGKLGTYILPCFPPFALLLAAALSERMQQGSENRSVKTGICIFGFILVAVLITVPAAAILNRLGMLPELDHHIMLKFIGAFAGLSLAITSLIVALRSGNTYRRLMLLGASSAALFVTFTCCAPTEISTSLGIQGFLKSEQANIGDGTLLVGDPKTTHAMCYVYKRNDIYLFSHMGEFDYGLSYPEAEHRFLDDLALKHLILNRGDKRIVVCIKAKPGNSIKAQLPRPSYQHQWIKIWFAVYEPQSKE